MLEDATDQWLDCTFKPGLSEVRGWGLGLQHSNNLLKFVNFVSEKGYENQHHGNKDSNSYIFEEATSRMY